MQSSRVVCKVRSHHPNTPCPLKLLCIIKLPLFVFRSFQYNANTPKAKNQTFNIRSQHTTSMQTHNLYFQGFLFHNFQTFKNPSIFPWVFWGSKGCRSPSTSCQLPSPPGVENRRKHRLTVGLSRKRKHNWWIHVLIALYIYIHINTYRYIYLEPVCPLFWGLNPAKQGPFQAKQGSFGFQVT